VAVLYEAATHHRGDGTGATHVPQTETKRSIWSRDSSFFAKVNRGVSVPTLASALSQASVLEGRRTMDSAILAAPDGRAFDRPQA